MCRPSVAKESARVLSRCAWLSCHKSFNVHRTSDIKLNNIMIYEYIYILCILKPMISSTSSFESRSIGMGSVGPPADFVQN